MVLAALSPLSVGVVECSHQLGVEIRTIRARHIEVEFVPDTAVASGNNNNDAHAHVIAKGGHKLSKRSELPFGWELLDDTEIDGANEPKKSKPWVGIPSIRALIIARGFEGMCCGARAWEEVMMNDSTIFDLISEVLIFGFLSVNASKLIAPKTWFS